MKKNEKISFSQIKENLRNVNNLADPLLKQYENDSRVCVQKYLKTLTRKIKQRDKLIKEYQEKWTYEKQAQSNDFKLIAGIDEVGRGPLAGPVLACAVILPTQEQIGNKLIGLDDSKKLSVKKRKYFAEIISKLALSIGIGVVEPAVIDQINIYEATKLAMIAAIKNLTIKPNFLLIDALKLACNIPQLNLIKGDTKSISIAAASVVAKVTRDALMADYAKKYPGYGFEKNAGYGTKLHLNGLKINGVTPIHRKSFAPVKMWTMS